MPPTKSGAVTSIALTNRSRLEHAVAGKTQLEAAVHNLEDALGNLNHTGVAHPITEELRDALLSVRRATLKTGELVKRIP